VDISDTRGVLSSSLSISTFPSTPATPELLLIFPPGAVTVRMIRSFSLFNFSKLEAGVTRNDGDPDVFPTVPSASEPLDILARNDDVRFVMMDVDPADGGLML
jgi:hypothetical protein